MFSSSKPTTTSTRGRKSKCVGHLPKPDCDSECKYCFETSKDGSLKATKIKYCEGCNGFHSAKNFKREQEKHSTSLSGEDGSVLTESLTMRSPPFTTSSIESNVTSTRAAAQSFQPLQPIVELSCETSKISPCDDTQGTSLTSQETKISLYQREAMCSSSRYGNYHSNTLTILEQLAREYCLIGLTDKALNIYNKIIEGKERTVGFHHEETMTARLRRAHLLMDSQLYDQAEAAMRALVDQLNNDPLNRYASKTNPLNLNVFYGLAQLWHLKSISQSQPLFASAAEQLLSCIYSRRLRLYGENDLKTVKTLHKKALSIETQGRYLDALSVMNQTLTSVTESLGNYDVYTIEVRKDLSRVTIKLSQEVAKGQCEEDIVTANHLYMVAQFVDHGNVIIVHPYEDDEDENVNNVETENGTGNESAMVDDEYDLSVDGGGHMEGDVYLSQHLARIIDEQLEDLHRQCYSTRLVEALSCLGRGCDKEIVSQKLCLLKKSETAAEVRTKSVVSQAFGNLSNF